MTNYSILLRNVLDHLETDDAQAAFLWAAEAHDKTRMKFPAERFAVSVKRLEAVTVPGIAAAAKPHGLSPEGQRDLWRFILKRHACDWYGRNVKMWFEQETTE